MTLLLISWSVMPAQARIFTHILVNWRKLRGEWEDGTRQSDLGTSDVGRVRVGQCAAPQAGSGLGRRTVSPFQSGLRLGVCCLVPFSPPGRTARPRAGRGADYTVNRAGVSVLVGGWDY